MVRFLRQQVERNAEQDQIHHGEIPQRPGRTGEAAKPYGFDDGKGDAEQQERNAETKIRREPGPAPGELEPLLFFLRDGETETIAERFELSRVAFHGISMQ